MTFPRSRRCVIEQVAEPYIRGKALRHLRNRMAHEFDTDGVCTEADAAEAGGGMRASFPETTRLRA